MKFLLLFIFSFNAVAGLPPTSLKGQNNTSANTTFFFQAPNNQATPVAPSTGLIETGNKDLFANGSFEHTTFNTGWTSTGSCTITEETTVVIDGKKSAEIVCAGAGFSFTQETTLYASQFTNGQTAQLSYWIKNNDPAVDVCFMQAGAEEYCVGAANVPDDNEWHWVRLPVILKGTSNGIRFKAGTSAGTTYIDGVRLDLKDPLELQQIQYKAVLDATGSGNFTGGSVLVTRQGNQVNVTTLTSITHASLSSPASAVGFLPVWARPGSIKDNTYVSVSNEAQMMRVSNTGVLTFFYSTMSTGAALNKTSSSAQASSSYSVNDNLDNTLFTYDRCADRRKCETVFSAQSNSSGVPQRENLDFINGNAVVSDTSRFTYTFQSIFAEAPICTITGEQSSTLAPIGKIESVSNTTLVVRTYNNSATNTAFAHHIICQRSGQDYLNAKVNQILGQFLASNLDGGLDLGIGNKGVVFGAFFGGASNETNCTSSPCTRYDGFGELSSNMSVTRTGTGTYNLTVTGLKPSTRYFCSSTSVQVGTDQTTSIPAPNQTDTNGSGAFTAGFLTRRQSDDVAGDSYIMIQCWGARP